MLIVPQDKKKHTHTHKISIQKQKSQNLQRFKGFLGHFIDFFPSIQQPKSTLFRLKNKMCVFFFNYSFFLEKNGVGSNSHRKFDIHFFFLLGANIKINFTFRIIGKLAFLNDICISDERQTYFCFCCCCHCFRALLKPWNEFMILPHQIGQLLKSYLTKHAWLFWIIQWILLSNDVGVIRVFNVSCQGDQVNDVEW